MLRNTMLTLLMLALAAAGPAGAGLVPVSVITIDDSVYLEAGGTVDLPFDAGRSLENVTQVGLQMTVVGYFGRSVCWEFGNYGGGTWTHREDVGLTVGFRQGDRVVAAGGAVWPEDADPTLANFVEDATLLLDVPDWSFLADGAGTLVLGGLPCAYDPTHPEVCICDPSLPILIMDLVVGLDGSVPAAPASWGALKSRYR